jgi:hypothetical protein
VKSLHLQVNEFIDIHVHGNKIVLEPQVMIPKDQAYFYSTEWQKFVQHFEGQFKSLLRAGQKISGLLEETRALAAHAGVDDRSEEERTHDPLNRIEKTFRILEQMVITILNEHLPRNDGSSPIFQTRWSKNVADEDPA